MSKKQLTLFDTPSITVDPLGTVILILQRTRFGIERKVSMKRLEVKADKTLLSLQAKIMDSPEMKQLVGLDSSITRDISKLALPSIFRFGAYVVPMELMGTIEAKLVDYAERRELLHRAVVSSAEQRIDEARTSLGDLAQDIRWPSPSQINAMFSLRWRFVSIGLPESLKAVDPDLYERESKKIREDLEQTRQLIEETLVVGFKEFNQWLVERLTPDPERKRKKTVKTTALQKFKDFLSYLPTRNVTGMEYLDTLATRASEILQNVDSKELVTNEGLAGAVKSQFETIQRQLVDFTEEAKGRIITFEEEEA